MKMYVKMKKMGPVGGRAVENFVCRSGNALDRPVDNVLLSSPRIRINSRSLTGQCR